MSSARKMTSSWIFLFFFFISFMHFCILTRTETWTKQYPWDFALLTFYIFDYWLCMVIGNKYPDDLMIIFSCWHKFILVDKKSGEAAYALWSWGMFRVEVALMFHLINCKEIMLIIEINNNRSKHLSGTKWCGVSRLRWIQKSQWRQMCGRWVMDWLNKNGRKYFHSLYQSQCCARPVTALHI